MLASSLACYYYYLCVNSVVVLKIETLVVFHESLTVQGFIINHSLAFCFYYLLVEGWVSLVTV